MSVIGVEKLPKHITLATLVQSLARVIRGQFEALNFTSVRQRRVCYIRLSKKLDPVVITDRINNETCYIAFIADEVPDKTVKRNRKGKIPLKTCLALGIPAEINPDQVFVSTHREILIELQSKYTGLYNLSMKTGHKLLETLSEKIFERLKPLVTSNPEALATGFQLSKLYRRLHPHFGDFQLILSSLHLLQDAAGVPRTQLAEHDLATPSLTPCLIDNIPYHQVQSACNKYSQKIAQKISDHIKSLTVSGKKEDPEEMARRKVRTELKKLRPYMPMIIKQVISNHFVPQKSPLHRVRVYGEPYLPGKVQLLPVLKAYRAVRVLRSDRMYNFLRLSVPLAHFGEIMALDGSVVGDSKLTVRAANTPLYRIPRDHIVAMKALFGVEHVDGPECDDDLDINEDEL